MSAPARWRPGVPPAESLPLIGDSLLWTRAVSLAERYAPTRLPILLVGATGTGKEVLAQHIHRLSRRAGEFVDVNCAALPREMIESLLFGHCRGAFTGASDDGVGLITQAGGGTLFLDELSSLPPEGQAKLLRVLETGELRRLGDHRKQRVDFRVIGAVQAEESLVDGGLLRSDLYHRVASVVIRLPRLRERPEDLGLLAGHFAARHGHTIAVDALPLLREHDWPGNVRELRAVIDRATVLADEHQILACHLVEALHGFGPGDAEARRALLGLCRRHDGDRDALARAVGVSRATLYRRLKAAGIRLASIRKQDLGSSQSSRDAAETA